MYNKRITDYLNLFKPKNNVLTSVERTDKERALEVAPEVGAFLGLLVKTGKCKHILEIGTCLGYSTIWMAQNLPLDGLIDTIEADKKRATNAEENFRAATVAEKIRVLQGFALDILPNLKREYDLIFIDALKQEYPKYLEYSLRLAKKGCVIVGDDVLLGELGWCDEASKKALHEFNQTICHELSGILLPIGDGLALTTV
jgi:predicted O-methyltransferase YrrM